MTVDPIASLERMNAEAEAAEAQAVPVQERLSPFGDYHASMARYSEERANLPPLDPFIGSADRCALAAGQKLEIVGQSKTGKTWFSLDLALHLAAGKDFLGLPIPKPRRVLYLNLEVGARFMGDRLFSRLEEPAKTYGIYMQQVEGRLELLDANGDAALLRENFPQVLGGAGFDIVFVDPRYKLYLPGENENEAASAAEVQAFFDAIRRAGPAVAYVHHDGKGAAGERDIVDRGAGSGVTGRDYDLRICLSRHANDRERLRVIETSARNCASFASFSAAFETPEGLNFPTWIRTEDDPRVETAATLKESRCGGGGGSVHESRIGYKRVLPVVRNIYEEDPTPRPLSQLRQLTAARLGYKNGRSVVDDFKVLLDRGWLVEDPTAPKNRNTHFLCFRDPGEDA